MGGPKKDMAVSKPPRGYGWSGNGFPNTTYTLKFATNLRNENFSYPDISDPLKKKAGNPSIVDRLPARLVIGYSISGSIRLFLEHSAQYTRVS